MKKNVILLGLLLTGLVVSGYFYISKLDTFDTEKTKSIATIRAEKLMSDLKLDKAKYNARFKDQVVNVKGIIEEINYKNDRHSILLKGDQENLSLVICDMQQDQIKKTRALKKGDTVLLKGIFKGFLKDAIFLNCVLPLNQQSND